MSSLYVERLLGCGQPADGNPNADPYKRLQWDAKSNQQLLWCYAICTSNGNCLLFIDRQCWGGQLEVIDDLDNDFKRNDM